MTNPTLNLIIEDEKTLNELDDAEVADQVEDAAVSVTGGPGRISPEPVVNIDQGKEYDEIGDAVDEAEKDDTIEVKDGTYEEEESVTIDVEDLTLDAAEGASPTVTQDGEIPVLVSESDVSVDSENIDFQSGIDVGADFSDYEPGLDEENADAIVTANPEGDDEYDSIGAALEAEQSDTDILVKSDYDSSNEDETLEGHSDAQISIVHEDVNVISEEGPEETEIDEDTGGELPGRALDINAQNVVFKGFDLTAEAEGIVVSDVEDAPEIVIRDNKIDASDGIFNAEWGPADWDVATSKKLLIENNKIETSRLGIAIDDGASNPEIKGNTVRGDNLNAIQVSSGGGVEGAVIKRNLLKDNRDDLVVPGGDTVTEVTNNHFVSDDRYAVRLSDDVGDVNVSNNWFSTEDEDEINDLLDDQDGDSIDLDKWAGAPIDPDAGDDGEE